MNVNFIFVRHGYACHNALSTFMDLTGTHPSQLVKSDPELTQIGADASENNGIQLANILGKFKKSINLNKIHYVMASPLLRSIETAYFMTKNFINPPRKIYVMGHLREIDESSIKNPNPQAKYSQKSRDIMKAEPSYRISSISTQQKHLNKFGINNLIDYKFVTNKYEIHKTEPGDILSFLKFIAQSFLPKVLQHFKKDDTINFFVVTHAGVLHDFTKRYPNIESQGFRNNTGFLLQTTYNIHSSSSAALNINKFISLTPDVENNRHFYTKYKFQNTDYFCPSNRCTHFCNVIDEPRQRDLKRLVINKHTKLPI